MSPSQGRLRGGARPGVRGLGHPDRAGHPARGRRRARPGHRAGRRPPDLGRRLRDAGVDAGGRGDRHGARRLPAPGRPGLRRGDRRDLGTRHRPGLVASSTVRRRPSAPAGELTRSPRSTFRSIAGMTAQQLISFARGAPSLDIIDVEGLKAAAVRAFDADPAGVTAYGTSVGYPPLRKWIADKHGVAPEQVLVTNGSLQADAFLFNHLVRAGRRGRRRAADLRPDAAQPAPARAPRCTRWRWTRTASTSTRCARCWSRGYARSSRTSSRTTRTRPA